MPEDAGSLAFVSMYLPRRYDDAGIRYYGRITRITYLVRSQIPYPMTHNNPDEMYCRLDVASWHVRSVPISIKEEGVYTPQMTYSFLFVHCRETYELFHIHSAEDFLLLQKLRNLAQKNAPDDTPIAVLSKEKKEIYRFSPSAFKRSPLRIYHELKEKLSAGEDADHG